MVSAKAGNVIFANSFFQVVLFSERKVKHRGQKGGQSKAGTVATGCDVQTRVEYSNVLIDTHGSQVQTVFKQPWQLVYWSR